MPSQAQCYWSGALQHHSRHICAGGRWGHRWGAEADERLFWKRKKNHDSCNICTYWFDAFPFFMEICEFLRFFWCVEFLIARVFCQSLTLARCTLVVIACVKHLVTPKRSFVSPHVLAIRCPAGHSKRCEVCTLLTATLSLCNLATQLTSGTPNISQQVELGSSTHLTRANRWKICSC